MKTNTVFISGHLDLTQGEFHEHYRPKISEYVDAGCSFVVGDARGADFMAQTLLTNFYLYLQDIEVTVYHMLTYPRNYTCMEFKTVGGYKSDTERDEAMTKASTLDLAWVRPGREKSGTAKNLLRRKL